VPDFRIDDTAPEHAKLRAAGPAAVGIWAMAGAYAMRELTDGWVPAYWVNTWPQGRKYAARLCRVTLWTPETRGGIDGYRFHDWLGYQRSASQIEKEREQARDRMRRNRSTELRPKSRRTVSRTSPERSGNVHDSLPLSQGEGLSSPSHPGEPAREDDRAPFDPEVGRRGLALVRAELDRAHRRKALRSPESVEEVLPGSAGPDPAERPSAEEVAG